MSPRRSLERQLPLGIGALLVVTVVVLALAAYREVRTSAAAAAADRLDRATRQLSDLLTQSTRTRFAMVESVTALPALREFVRAPTRTAAPVAALRPLAEPATVQAVEVWDASGRRLAVAARDTGRGVLPLESGRVQTIVGSLREARSAITPFHMAGDTVVYALVTTIVDGRRLAGYLVERRRLTASPNAGRQLAELIGERARLAVGNVAGDLWNDFSRPISGVPAAVAAPGPHEYERDGVAVLAQSARIAATPWQILIEFPRDLVFARAQTFLVRVGWITLALLGIGIGGAWAAGRWIARPLRRVTEAAEAIAAGQLTAPLTSGRTDEIGRLNTAFNTMASQVTRSRVRLEAQVEERTAALQETLQELEAFSYTVSHDLRAPLRAMQGFAQALLEDYGRSLDATGHDYATRVVEASRRMDELIQDLLAYGRLSRQELSLGAVDLDGVTTDAIRSVADDAQRRGGAIDVASPLGEVVGNARLLQQVIENLVANAVKFVPPGVAPRVRIASETLNGRRRLWVQDNGIGVAPEHQERIFRVFERLHGGETYPGTGIGLAIVRRAIERMDGHVGVESSPGAGSRFWIELPVGGAR